MSALVEIGIDKITSAVLSLMVGFALEAHKLGRSVRAWRDFFPNATIHRMGCPVGYQIRPPTTRS